MSEQTTPNTPESQGERIKNFFREQISSGRWQQGCLTPSEKELVTLFGVSRMTVNRALRDLALAGIITRVRGSGTRVANFQQVGSRLTIHDIHEEILQRGHSHSARVLAKLQKKANTEIARQFNIRVNETLFFTKLLHFENECPIQLEERFVNPAAAPHYLDNDFSIITPTSYLLNHAPLTEAKFSISACNPTEEEASLLAVDRREACLEMRRVTVSYEHTASLARLLYPGSRYQFTGEFQV